MTTFQAVCVVALAALAALWLGLWAAWAILVGAWLYELGEYVVRLRARSS